APFKLWIATADDRTRPEHLSANGQCVETDEPFRVGGEGLAMPGDPSGSAGMIINCRCTILYAPSCEAGQSRFSDAIETVDEEAERRGNLDIRETEGSVLALSDDALKARNEISELPDLDGLDVSTIERLPQGTFVEFPDGVVAHGHRLGAGVGYRDGQRLYYADTGLDNVVDGITSRDVIRSSIDNARDATPGGIVDNPLRSIVHSSAPNQPYIDATGQNVWGLASSNTVAVYPSPTSARTLADLVRPGTVRHEVGHSIARAGSAQGIRRYSEVSDKLTAARYSVAGEAPDWLKEAAGDLQNQVGQGLTIGGAPRQPHPAFGLTGPKLVDRFGGTARERIAADLRRDNPALSVNDAFDEARKVLLTDARAFVKARNAATKAPTEELRRVIAASPYYDDELARFANYVESGLPAQTVFNAPANFNRAANADARRLVGIKEAQKASAPMGERLDARELARSLSARRWDDELGMNNTISYSGYSTRGGKTRPGVTPYGASVDHGIEDWAEAWRLYTYDRKHDGLGDSRAGTRVRFADLFPNRAQAITEWADAMGFDLTAFGR
ncbi:MAG: hypothetical protein ABR616_18305, partial [Dermatophilaceae bacterium]